MNPSTFFTLIFMMGTMFCTACTEKSEHKKPSEPEELRLLKNEAVVLPDNLLATNSDMQRAADNTLLNRSHKVIVYVKQDECDVCRLKSLTPLYLFMLENEYRKDFGVVFILNTTEMDTINEILKEMRFNRTVFYDLDGSFERLNTHLPKDMWYHTFLLNDENKVVMAGNFAYNEVLKRRYLAEIEKLTAL